MTAVVAGVKKQCFDRQRRQRGAEMRTQTQRRAQSGWSGEASSCDRHRRPRFFRVQYPVRLLAGTAESKSIRFDNTWAPARPNRAVTRPLPAGTNTITTPDGESIHAVRRRLYPRVSGGPIFFAAISDGDCRKCQAIRKELIEYGSPGMHIVVIYGQVWSETDVDEIVVRP